ncbi:UNVERIFIED_CONTAM: hypothetical protein Sangu_2888100 [Sesamum angustifolium]|uniref:Reverse transcriptase domain-containing protein n=1 Tax=Sesamum angustifolium TaxID=2727405 RepID=A0AAW2INU0_9LAMI
MSNSLCPLSHTTHTDSTHTTHTERSAVHAENPDGDNNEPEAEILGEDSHGLEGKESPEAFDFNGFFELANRVLNGDSEAMASLNSLKDRWEQKFTSKNPALKSVTDRPYAVSTKSLHVASPFCVARKPWMLVELAIGFGHFFSPRKGAPRQPVFTIFRYPDSIARGFSQDSRQEVPSRNFHETVPLEASIPQNPPVAAGELGRSYWGPKMKIFMSKIALPTVKSSSGQQRRWWTTVPKSGGQRLWGIFWENDRTFLKWKHCTLKLETAHIRFRFGSDSNTFRWNIGQTKVLARLLAVLERLYILTASPRTAPDSTLPGEREKECSSAVNDICSKTTSQAGPKQPEQSVQSMENNRPESNSGLESARTEQSTKIPQLSTGISGPSGLNKGKDIVLHNSYSALAVEEAAAGRIWLAWDSLEVGIEILEVGSQFIHCRAANKRMHTRCLITVLYGDYDIIPRRELWNALRNLSAGIQDEPWLILGDFNAVMDDSEVCGQAADTSASMAEFRSCVRDTGLVPLPFTGCPFTWHNCSEGPRSLWKRLDRMLVNGLGWMCGLGRHTSLPYRAHQTTPRLYSLERTELLKTLFSDSIITLPTFQAEFRSQKKRTGELSMNVRKAKDFLDKAQTLFSTYKEDIYLTLVKCCRRVYAVAVKLEISMLQQRAKLRWLKDGDQNSKVFFRKINLTRAKQRVFQITQASGETLTNQHEVIQEFISYFQTLIGSSNHPRTVDLGFLQHEIRRITPAEASFIVTTVTAAEVREALFDIDVESAPGPDGFGSAFYRAAWPVVGQSMFEAVGEFFPNSNHQDYSEAYTAGSTLLINYSQNAFVPGRSISDNILLAQELLAGYNQMRLPERCTLKVDIQKAYDSVEWDFLLEVLKLFNFPTHFINLIEQCVTTASFSVSLNGAIHGFFKGGRGLRQGDPMSPYLFVLVMEVGSALLRYRVRNATQFHKEPDHTFPSGAAAKATAFGLRGFQEGSLPIKYLGIPLTSSRLTIADCRPLFDKVDTRIAGWNHQNLSYAGRIQLIKSVLSTLHTYWASVFILPKGVLKMLERKMRSFLWQGPSGGRQAKVAWDQISKPKAEGGLGMRSLIIMNQALMLKQMWRILQNDGSSIWVDWIQRYRLRHTTLWTFNRTTGSWCWKKMLKLRPILQRGVNYKVGDGSSFSLWQDVWHERGPLCLSYPRGVEITGLPLSSTLSAVLQRHQWCWPAATDSDIAEIITLLPPTNPSTADTIYWRSNSGKFTLHSAILLIQPPSPPVHWQGLFQGKFKIPRHGFILWLAVLEKLSTMDKPWVPRSGNGCVLCGGQFSESHDHLFFKCWFSKRCLTILKHKDHGVGRRCSNCDLYFKGVIYKIGDGSSFSLWQDAWHERGPLCLTFPQGPEVTGLPLSSSLSSVIQSNQWCWPASTDVDIIGITSQLPPLHPSAADCISWRSSSGKFTFLAAVSLIQPTTPRVSWYVLLQGNFKIPRHVFILWMAILEKLSTMDKPWVPRTENGCVLCGGLFVETHDHLFFKCSYSKRCLSILRRKIRFQWPFLEWQTGLIWASKRWRASPH